MSWQHLAGPRLSLSSKVTSPDVIEGRRTGSRGFWSELVHRGGSSGIPCPRSMHAGAVSHSKLYIFGGYDGYQRSNDLYTYDFSTNVWTLLNASGTIPPRRDRHTAVVYLNTLVIFGGYDGRMRLNGNVYHNMLVSCTVPSSQNIQHHNPDDEGA